MGRGFFLCCAGLTLLTLSSGYAQTAPVSAVSAPNSQAPLSPSQVPSRPAYDPNKEKPDVPVYPVPTPAPPPVILREPPPPGRPKYTQREIYTAYEPYIKGPQAPSAHDELGSTYIPVDSWVYPEMLRLYGMGYIDTAFLNMRPWTRRSVLHMLQASQNEILRGGNEEAQAILAVLLRELADETPVNGGERKRVYGVQSVYARALGINGQTLRDSFHLGQTIVNDYGRPYEPGFNNQVGVSSVNEMGPFSLYVRGEYQQAPGGTGYSNALATLLSNNDQIPYAAPNLPQATIPGGLIASQNPLRLIEATLSAHLLGHEVSLGKTDAWLGPGMGGAMAWSNNAENIYSFRINRVEPLYIPFVSRITGPLRYDFFYGSLKGHTAPNHPYIHSEMISFAPTQNLVFGFQRSIIFGGAGHEPVTFHNFLRGFFSISDTTAVEKFSPLDPGARFSAFNFSYRVPLMRRYLTFYADSITHDDVTPPSAPRRAAYRPGLYLSHIPGAAKFDLRAEATVTDFSTHTSNLGSGNYWEVIQRQGYTNKGFILGDWIGREAKGGQAWLTYHLSGNEWIQLEYLNKKTPHDFIPGGTTQNSFTASVVKRIGKEFEVNGWVQHERWKAPIYLQGLQSNTTVSAQLTWFPKLHTGEPKF